MAIKCPRCRSENPDTQSFCGDCGTQLGQSKETSHIAKTFETPAAQFSPGSSLAGRYKIIRELGKGGMGEVYLAEDTDLKRQVAIKVLPREFALDTERLARFEREARVLASLNHPHIATIYGLERSAGQQLLIMELVEGETLAERLKKGHLSIEDALELCRQTAEGLESAHEKGIIHRDLKPENIKITKEGRVKILDFGLAKAYREEPEAFDLSISPTLTDQMTQPGVILGTAAYMSPEQAKGKEVDKKTDVWAFGCILFECLTGKKAFEGESAGEIIASILKDEPDLKELHPSTPIKILEIIRRCTVKEPRDRLHDIADARIILAEAQREPELATKTPGIQRASAFRFSWLWLLLGLIGGAAIMAILFFGLLPGPTRTAQENPIPSHFTFELDEAEEISIDTDQLLFDISSNGEKIAWIGPPKPERKIFYRSLNSLEVNAVPGSDGVSNVYIAFSPDGREVSFSRDGALWRTPLEGGIPQKLFEGGADGSIWSWDWGERDTVVIGPAYSGLLLISKPGAETETLTTLNAETNEVVHQFPTILPDNKGVLFSVGEGFFHNTHIEALAFDSPEIRTQPLLKDVYFVEYIPTGHLVFGREGTIYAAPFDLRTLAVTGPEVPVLSDIQCDTWGMVDQFAVSQNGTLIYIPEQGLVGYELAWIATQGQLELLPFPSQPYFEPRISPLGDQVAVTGRKLGERGRNVSVLDLRRNIVKELVRDGHVNYSSAWSSDGSQLVMNSSRDGVLSPFLLDITGKVSEKKLITGTNDCYVTSWSKDGRQLIYTERLPYDKMRIGILSFDDSESKLTLLTSEDKSEKSGYLSPEGLWLAYVSLQEDQRDVYIRNMDGSIREKVSSAGGDEPAWSPDGTKLYYMNKNGTALLSVEVKTATGLELGSETVIVEEPDGFEFLKHSVGTISRASYDVHPGGQRFLFVVRKKREQKMKVGVILNWFEELEQKMAAENR